MANEVLIGSPRDKQYRRALDPTGPPRNPDFVGLTTALPDGKAIFPADLRDRTVQGRFVALRSQFEVQPAQGTWLFQFTPLVGAQFTALPPTGRIPIRPDLYWTNSLNLLLEPPPPEPIPDGQQYTALPPRGPLQGNPYHQYVQNLPLLSVEPDLPYGLQVTALPPRGPLRGRQDYIPGPNVPLQEEGLFVPIGAQATTLPPSGPARGRQDYVPGPNTALLGFEPLPFGAQVTTLPPRGPRRGRQDYVPGPNTPLQVQSLVFPVGTQSTTLPPRGPLRGNPYYTFGPDVPLLTQALVYPVGIQSTTLPPPGPRRGRQDFNTTTLLLHPFRPLVYYEIGIQTVLASAAASLPDTILPVNPPLTAIAFPNTLTDPDE